MLVSEKVHNKIQAASFTTTAHKTQMGWELRCKELNLTEIHHHKPTATRVLYNRIYEKLSTRVYEIIMRCDGCEKEFALHSPQPTYRKCATCLKHGTRTIEKGRIQKTHSIRYRD